MTFNEFKSWLDGFSEAIGDAPTPEQWAKVKAKVNEVANPLGNLQFPAHARSAGGFIKADAKGGQLA